MMNIVSPLSGSMPQAREATEELQKKTESPATQSQPLPADDKKLGIALAGLGKYAEEQLMPALHETEYCRLAGVVSGNADKRRYWCDRYNVKPSSAYDYRDFDSIADNNDIDIVYIVLPNALHAEYVIRAAQAGKHVICEKPMATNVADCQRMIDACRNAGVRLSIGYRLHFDPFNQEVMRLGQSHALGSIERIVANNGLAIAEKEQWRLDRGLAGGGPLMDVGIYCVQAAIYCIGELPYAVTARFHEKTDPYKFADVEEGISWEMYFSAGVKAHCSCTYIREEDLLRVEAVSGWLELAPAFAYSGLKGRTSQGTIMVSPLNQHAAQMDDFALCVRNNLESRVPGEMGMRDVEILEAIYRSAETGVRVPLELAAFQQLPEL